jgi:hypothetical protein
MIEQSVSLASNGVVKVPGYEQLVRFGYTKNRGVYRLHVDATGAEQAKTDAQTAAQQAGASAQKAGQALSDTINAKEDALKAIGDKQTTATQAVDTARDKALQQVEALAQAYYDALDAEDKANAEEIVQ